MFIYLSKSLSNLMNIILGIPMFVLGVIGTIFIDLIFRTNSGIHYLLADTVANFLMLINVLLPRILPEGFALPLYNFNEVFCRQRLYISGAASVCAVYFPCWTTFDQYACSSGNPLFRQRWSSINFTRRMILLTGLISAIIHIPHFIFTVQYPSCLCIGYKRSKQRFNPTCY